MWPELGAGRSVTRIKGPAFASVEYAARRTASRPVRRAADALSVRVNRGGMVSGCPAGARFNRRQNEDLREAGWSSSRCCGMTSCSARLTSAMIQHPECRVAAPTSPETTKTPLKRCESLWHFSLSDGPAAFILTLSVFHLEALAELMGRRVYRAALRKTSSGSRQTR